MTRPLTGVFVRMIGLPALIWMASVLAMGAIAHTLRPDMDTRGWGFLILVLGITSGIYVVTALAALVLTIRWLLRYRTGRRGRRVALRNVLRPGDAAPTWRRRMMLMLYGVNRTDLAMAATLWRT